MLRHHPRLALAFLAAGVLLVSILAGIVVPLGANERDLTRETVIKRYAAVLYPEALQQLAESEASLGSSAVEPAELLYPVLKTKEQADLGLVGVVVYDSEGNVVEEVPTSIILPDLPPEDYARLLGGEQISRYDPAFPLSRYFAMPRKSWASSSTLSAARSLPPTITAWLGNWPRSTGRYSARPLKSSRSARSSLESSSARPILSSCASRF
ncbi:MAG: hypothetical protein ABSA05_04645 [Opitutaceae bacterium]